MSDTENKSDVEKFYEATQKKLGGNVPWGELPVSVQLAYIRAVDVIYVVGSYQKENAT